MNIRIVPAGSLEANCLVAWNDPAAAWIIDPGAEPEKIAALLVEHGLKPALVALTHAHFDHIGAVPGLLETYPGLPVHIAPEDVQVAFDPRNRWEPDYSRIPRPATLAPDLTEGFTLEAGGLSAQIVHTPGHTPGSVCFLFGNGNILATGDTLFAGSCGRTDFPGGDSGAMRASLARLAALPDALRVIPGHGRPTSIGEEKRSNPYMAAR